MRLRDRRCAGHTQPTAAPEGKATAIALMEDYVKFKITEQVLAPLAQGEPHLTLDEVLRSVRTEADRALTEIVRHVKIADDQTP